MILTKMQADGNDFLLVNGLENHINVEEKRELAKRLCRRRFSFGADGMIFLEASKDYAFTMDFYNADGSSGEMCGNGARCLARFAFELVLVGDEMTFDTAAGPVGARRLKEGVYSLSMQLPSVYEEMTIQLGSSQYQGAYVELGDPGVPHFCLEVEEQLDRDKLRELAKGLRYHQAFPKGSNINFYHLGDKVHVLTYERGVEDFTLACGSGVTSVAYHLVEKGCFEDTLDFLVLGGELRVDVLGKNPIRELHLIGPVEKVYQAEYLANRVST